jgi:CTP:molybdopterin cytidylyltransferase MocA
VLERLAQADGIDLTVVVEGAHRLPPLETVTVVHADDWETGPGASLRAGLGALPAAATHALVVLADGPALDPRAVERLIAHRAEDDVLAATYDGTRSHPVLLARPAWSDLPDAGGRALEATLVDCSDLEPPGDVDYPPDV